METEGSAPGHRKITKLYRKLKPGYYNFRIAVFGVGQVLKTKASTWLRMLFHHVFHSCITSAELPKPGGQDPPAPEQDLLGKSGVFLGRGGVSPGEPLLPRARPRGFVYSGSVVELHHIQ